MKRWFVKEMGMVEGVDDVFVSMVYPPNPHYRYKVVFQCVEDGKEVSGYISDINHYNIIGEHIHGWREKPSEGQYFSSDDIKEFIL